MRALVITLSLAMIAALLVGTLVVFGGVRVNQTLLALLGGVIFMVAALFACISAIGPKYRPTPALTPIMAGTSAAALTAVLVLVANLQLSSGHAAAFRTSAAQPTAREASAPVPEARSVEPGEVPVDPSALPPADAFVAIPSADDVPMDAPPAEGPAVTAAFPTTEPLPLAVPGAPGAVNPPIPVARPRSPSETPQRLAPGETATLSDQPFDVSTIPAARGTRATPPQTTARVTPPLPRIRPCGAGGPPCP